MTHHIAGRVTSGTHRSSRRLAGAARVPAVLYLRLVPAVSFDALNYAAGLSTVRFADYLLATVIGIVPGTVAFVMLSDALSRPGSPQFLAALGSIVVLALAARVSRRARRGHDRRAR